MSEPESLLSLWKGPLAASRGGHWLSVSLSPSLVKDACRWASETHGVGERDIMSKSRVPHVVLARHALMWRLRQYKRGYVSIYSYPTIGRAIDMDHTSVMHGEKRYERWLAEPEA